MDYLEALLQRNGEYIIIKNTIVSGNKPKRWRQVIKNEEDLTAFMGRNFYMPTVNQEMKKLETYWSRIEGKFNDFARTLKQFVGEYAKSGYGTHKKSRINDFILNNQELIILYSLICVQREYIRFHYNNGLDFKDLLFEVEHCISDGPFQTNEENYYMNEFYSYYFDLMYNFDIRLIDSFHGAVLYDPSFIMTSLYLLIMYQSFGSIVFLRKKTNFSLGFDTQVLNEKADCIVAATNREEMIWIQSFMYKWIETEFIQFIFEGKLVYNIELKKS
jgi:hypothetical protein